MKKEWLIILICFIFLTLLFFYPIFKGNIPFPGDFLVGGYAPYNSYTFQGYAPAGYPHKGQGFDVLRLIYPAKEFSIQILKSVSVPLWNPYIFSGTPHLASLQSGTFYPLNILFFLLPFILAWTIYIAIQPILAGLFTYLFLREIELSKKSSFFGGIVFAFSSYMVVWMQYGNLGHTIIWLPLLLLLALKNSKAFNINVSLLMIVVLSMSILAGYIQTTFYIYVFLFLFVVFHIRLLHKKNRLQKFLPFVIIFSVPLFLTAVQLLPTIELILHSARSSYTTDDFIKLLIPNMHAITTFAPDFFGNQATRNYWLEGTYIERVTYIGVLPMFFVIYSFLYNRVSTKLFFLISIIVVTVLTFNTIPAQLFYSLQIPFISTAVPSRIMFLFCFCASVLAAFGLESFINNKNKKPILITASIMMLVYGLLWALAIFGESLFLQAGVTPNVSVSKRNLILPTLIFGLGMSILFIAHFVQSAKKFIYVAVVVLTIFDLFYFFHKITPFAPTATLYPQTEVLAQLRKIQGIDRSWGYGSARIDTNLQIHEKIYWTDGYDALHDKRYGEFVSSSKDGKIENPLPRSIADIAPGYGDSDLSNNLYRQKVLNMLGVKYILHKNDTLGKDLAHDTTTFKDDRYKLIWQSAPWQIYENLNAVPRAFLTNSYIVEKDPAKLLSRFYANDVDETQSILISEDPTLDKKKLTQKNVDVLAYEPNSVRLRTQSNAESLLFLSDTYFPGWIAYVDGKESKIFTANYAFRAVKVPEGEHLIEFIYNPFSFRLGFQITLISSLLVIISYILLRKKNFS